MIFWCVHLDKIMFGFRSRLQTIGVNIDTRYYILTGLEWINKQWIGKPSALIISFRKSERVKEEKAIFQSIDTE